MFKSLFLKYISVQNIQLESETFQIAIWMLYNAMNQGRVVDVIVQMNQKFTKEERQKFLRGLDTVNLDSDSEFEDSFYEKESKRMQAEISSLKNRKDWSVLEELKKNVQEEHQIINEYQKDREELHQITSNQAKNVIDPNIIEAIKQKVASQKNNSVLSLADEQYNQSVVNAIPAQQLSNASFMKVKTNMEKKLKAEQAAILKKIEVANQQREYLAMQQQDKLSMKFQMQVLSQLFKNRFIRPTLPKVVQKDTKIVLKQTKVMGSFIRLSTQPINESTVLPKNAPQIALKQLKQIKYKPIKPSSRVQVKVGLQKITAEQQKFEELSIANQQAQKQKSQVDMVFQKYLSNIKPVLDRIDRIATQYQPRFLRYLGQQQKNLNYQFEQVSTKQRSIEQVASLQNCQSLCELKLSFEKLTNVKGIQNFRNLEQAQLQFNLLNSVQSLQKCTKLIELNLSNNKLRSINALNSLPWLRLLNVENNAIQRVKLQCRSLQVLLASRNRVEEIEFKGVNQLRILKINYNRLHLLPELNLMGLEELEVSHNQISELQGINNFVLLKKIDLSFNRLTTVKDFLYLYLNELNLSNNSISSLDQLFLPCLQSLQLSNNRLQGRGKGTAYLPNLKVLNLDDNRLEGFGCIWWLIRYSEEIQILRYGNNQYFLSLREKIREVYQSLIYKTFSNLKILNDAPYDSGIAQYYRQNYSIYSNGSSFVSSETPLKRIHGIIRLFLRQSNFGRSLQQKVDSFIKQKDYIDYQWKHKVNGLKQVINILQAKSNELIVSTSLFYFYDAHQNARRTLFHLLRGVMLVRKLEQKRKRKHFVKLKPKITKLLEVLKVEYFVSQKLKALNKFKMLTKGLNENQAAIKIQKVWRGYIRRKIYKKLKARKIKLDQDSDFQDVDTDFFNHQLQKIELDLDLEGFEDVIIRPQVFQLLQAKQKQAMNKPKKQTKEVKNDKDEKGPLMNNFLDSRTKLKQPSKQSQENQAQKLMNEWHLKDPKVLKALQFKQQKRQLMRKKQMQKTMSAAQRLQRFRKGG